MRMLLVEDNPDHAFLVTACLKREFGPDVKVEVAQSGEEALERLSFSTSLDEPEIIILDYRLPGLSGLEVLATLREQQDPRPVVLVTGSNEQQLALKALRYGANDFVTKGVDFPENLVGAVARAHEHALLRRDLEAAQARIASLEVPLAPPNAPPAKLIDSPRERMPSEQDLLRLGQRLESLGNRLVRRYHGRHSGDQALV